MAAAWCWLRQRDGHVEDGTVHQGQRARRRRAAPWRTPPWAILGFDTYIDQNVNSVLTGADIEALTVTEPLCGRVRRRAGCASSPPENGEYMVVAGQRSADVHHRPRGRDLVHLERGEQVRHAGQCGRHPLQVVRRSTLRPPRAGARASCWTTTRPARLRRSASCSLSEHRGRLSDSSRLHRDRGGGRRRDLHGLPGSAAGAGDHGRPISCSPARTDR